jgi:hypothetical protein
MQDDAVHFESVAQIIPVVDDDGIIRFPDVWCWRNNRPT